ncbi:MAG: hypothetical protein O7E52_09535 [Candidatus Poribacteria bacterium]|nr:hypothetical protein [Candidatus Poribacteria bacterium]
MTTEKKGLFERSRQNKPVIRERFAKLLKELGIEGESIPAHQLRAMAEAEGIDPADNEFSRAIIEAREG